MSTLTVTIVQQTNAIEHDHLLAEMYRQRKRIFGDKLGWDVTIINGQEIDKYDIPCPVYLICTDEAGTVTGSLRLLPTTGPILCEVLSPNVPIYRTPRIWECSRFCAEDSKTAAKLIEALGEWGLAHNIEAVIGNFAPSMLPVYRRIGCEVQILSREGDTYLGVFPITGAILAKVKSRIKEN